MLKNYAKNLSKALDTIDQNLIDKLYIELKSRVDRNSTVHLLGNGGSAANASHISGDFTKTLAFINRRLNIISHSDNACYVTAASNDLDYSEVFSSKVGNYINKSDLIVYLSGSGNSLNLVKCSKKAGKLGVTQASLTAYNGGTLKDLTEIPIHINFNDMEIAEDIQLIIFHYLKQRLLSDLEDKDSDTSKSMPKYSKRIIENLIA